MSLRAQSFAGSKKLTIKDEDAVGNCLSDPKHTQCIVRSSGHAGLTTIDIIVTPAPLSLSVKTVYIKVTGPRSDLRSRSASPSRRSQNRTEPPRGNRHESTGVEWNYQPLPAAVNIDAIPIRKRFSPVTEWWARVRPAHVSFENIDRRAMNETNFHAEPITSMDLGRRVAEKDVSSPSICNHS